jgi:hypothetical protein
MSKANNHFTFAVIAIAAVVAIGIIALAANPGLTGKVAGGNMDCPGLEQAFTTAIGCCDISESTPGYNGLQIACDNLADNYAKNGCGTLSCGPGCGDFTWRRNYLGEGSHLTKDLCQDITDKNTCMVSYYTDLDIHHPYSGEIMCSVGDYRQSGFMCNSAWSTSHPTTCDPEYYSRDFPVYDHYGEYGGDTHANACGLITIAEQCDNSYVLYYGGGNPVRCRWDGGACVPI